MFASWFLSHLCEHVWRSDNTSLERRLLLQLLNFAEILDVQNIITKECVKSVPGIVVNETFYLPNQFRLFHQCYLQNRRKFYRSGFQKCNICSYIDKTQTLQTLNFVSGNSIGTEWFQNVSHTYCHLIILITPIEVSTRRGLPLPHSRLQELTTKKKQDLFFLDQKHKKWSIVMYSLLLPQSNDVTWIRNLIENQYPVSGHIKQTRDVDEL